MAVQLASAENLDVDFGTTKEFRWLEKTPFVTVLFSDIRSVKLQPRVILHPIPSFVDVGTEHATK